MSRKDTIIIAVLINAGLLVVLFASALKSSFSNQEHIENTKTKYVTEPIVKKEHPLNGGDEVDQALNKLAMTSITTGASALQTLAQTNSSMPASSFSAPISQSNPFVDDLKGLTASQSSIPSIAPSQITTVISEEKKTADYAEVKVKKGDVLEKIARLHHTSVDEIIGLNKLSSTNLRIGQTLKVPRKKTNETNSSMSAPTALVHSSHESKYYTVKLGDNPWTIAVKNHMKVEDLLKINNLDQEKARKLKPGDKLLIQ